MKFEMKRKIDELGRIVLPIDLRRYYGIESGDTIVLLPVREGIQVAKSDYFIMNQLPTEMAVTVDVDLCSCELLDCALLVTVTVLVVSVEV